jgi:uncharacterized protein involved in exopolysaccharide biosynthesis
LEAQRTVARHDLEQLNTYEVEIQQLDRTATLARTNFFGYADKLEQARVDEELDHERITNVAIAQDPTFAERPVSPSKLIVAALTLLLATAGTTALVLACEKLDARIHTEDQIEEILRLPVLAAVPEGRMYGAVPAAR